MRPPELFSELGSRRAKPATAECGSTGWISSRTTMLGILGSNVDLVSARVGKRGNSEGSGRVPDRSDRRELWLWRNTDAKACLACIRGRQNRRSPAVLRSALEPRGCDDGLDYLGSSTLKHSESSTVRLYHDQTAPAIARAARARAWGEGEHGWGRNSRRKTDSRSPGGRE